MPYLRGALEVRREVVVGMLCMRKSESPPPWRQFSLKVLIKSHLIILFYTLCHALHCAPNLQLILPKNDFSISAYGQESLTTQEAQFFSFQMIMSKVFFKSSALYMLTVCDRATTAPELQGVLRRPIDNEKGFHSRQHRARRVVHQSACWCHTDLDPWTRSGKRFIVCVL